MGLPFGAAGSARTYKTKKMEILLDHGLVAFNLGVQSGSQRVITEVYNRKISLSQVSNVVKELSPYCESRDLTVIVDFIIDNPYETKDDIMQTYNFLLDLPPSLKPNLFFLSFYPGTPIYKRAIQDGFTRESDVLNFRSYTGGQLRYQKNYASKTTEDSQMGFSIFGKQAGKKTGVALA